jgi:hypothetical protein
MPAFYEIKFLPEGTVVEFYGSEGNRYLLADGALLRMNAAPVWCRVCSKFAEGEVVEPLAEIDQQLADLRDENSLFYQVAQDSLAGPGFHAEMIAETQKRRKWREARIAGPKCLRCGTTEIVVLPRDQAIANPFSSGTLTLQFAGFASVAFSNGLFSPEGDRLDTAEKPSR